MSRIGKKPVVIPQGIEVNIQDNEISVKGPKGTLVFEHNPQVKVEAKDGTIIVAILKKTKQAPAIWGTTARIISNMITGVSQGFSKKLELNGVGYRMNLQGKKLTLALGFSHPVEKEIPEGLEIKIEQNTVTISGIDKQRVGQFTAELRALKPVEPYKGKGFRYAGEIVRKKEGKKVVSST